MKSRMILPLLPLVMAIMIFAGSSDAKAFDIGVSLGGSSRHHYNGGYYSTPYRTHDTVYSSWYPHSNSYVYTPSYSTGYYSNGYSSPTYIYSTESSGYNGWYGSGRSGRGGHYGHDRRGWGGHRR